MDWLGCAKQWKKNCKQHIQNKFEFLPWYLINGFKGTVQNILMSLISHEIKKVGGILAKPAPKKRNYHH